MKSYLLGITIIVLCLCSLRDGLVMAAEDFPSRSIRGRLLTPPPPTDSICGNKICEKDESLYSCPADCKESIPTLESDREYTVKIGERYQFEYRQIRISSIWDDSIVVDILLDTQSIGPRIWLGSPNITSGIKITLVKLHFEIEKEQRFAVIKIIRVRGETPNEAISEYEEKKEIISQPPETKGAMDNNITQREMKEDPFKDWKTYTNEDYGYEIRYPKGWKFRKRSLMKDLRHRHMIWLDGLSIDIWDTSVYSYEELMQPPSGGVDPSSIQEKTVVIDGYLAKEMSYVAVGDAQSGSTNMKTIYILVNRLVYKLDVLRNVTKSYLILGL